MADPVVTTLIRPDVYAGLVREKFEGRIRIASLSTELGFLKNTTVGEKVVFPKWSILKDAEDVLKGIPIVPEALSQTSTNATIMHKGKAVTVYDYDQLTGLGNAIDESANQMGIVFARELDKNLATEALTTSLLSPTADAAKITAAELNTALNLYGDEQDVEDFAGIVVNSLLVPSFFAMNEFVDKNKTYTTDGSGVIRNGLLGWFRSIPIYLSDKETYDGTAKECITYIIKKNALGYMTKRDINIELSRQALLKATDVVGDFIYACKLINDAGVVVVRKTIVAE